MKLGKASLVLIVVGILVIAFASLGAVRSQQVSQHDQIGEELDLTQLKIKQFQLEQLSQQQAELEAELSQTTSEFEAAEAALAQQMGGIAISSLLFDIARACGTEVVEISSSGTASEDLGGITCSVLTFNAGIEGDLLPLISFITRLNDSLATGFVKSVNISVPEAASGEKASANIQLVVYNYQGG